MMRVLITGSNGLVGSHLVKRFLNHDSVHVMGCSKSPNRLSHHLSFDFIQADLTEKDEVTERLAPTKPQAIYHCAAISEVDKCEKHPDWCYNSNVKATQHILELASAFNSKVIYYSTDFVFSGEKEEPYNELDSTDPISLYGQSKVEAEQLVRQYTGKWKIIRPILIYGTSPSVLRGNIVKWVRTELEQGRTIQVVTDQFRQPTPIDSLVDVSEKALMQGENGVYHIAGADRLSIYDFALRIADYYGLNRKLILPVSSKELNEPGTRPKKTFFDCNKAIQNLDFVPISIDNGLVQFDRF